MKILRLLNVLWLAPCFAFAGKPGVSQDDFLQNLRRLQSNPQVAEVLGKDGRLMEVVTYEAGLMVGYSSSKQDCVGKTYYDQAAGRELFSPGTGDSCGASTMNKSQTSAIGIEGSSTRDFKMFISAVSFVTKMTVVQPPMERVLAVRSDAERVIISYRPINQLRTCYFAMVPTLELNQTAPQMWRITGAIACDDR